MSLRTLTAANSVVMMGITGLYPTPQQIQGFAADEMFSTDAVSRAEVLMGVDGVLSGGYVYVEVKQTFTLQADSMSCDIFDNWDANEQSNAEVYIANGVISLPNIGKKWTMTRGFLTSYMPIPDQKKLSQPRKFIVTWNTISPSPV